MYTLDKDAIIHVRIKNITKDWLFEKANKTGMSVSDIVRYIIMDYRRKEHHGNVEANFND